MRIFASDRLAGLMTRLGMEEDVPIENSLVTRSIANAQRKVEGHNFDMRKQLLKFDDVANDQRKIIYAQRFELMSADNIQEEINIIREDAIGNLIDEFIPPQSMEELWDVEGLEKILAEDFKVQLPLRQWLEQENELDEELLRRRIQDAVQQHYAEREARFSPEIMRQVEKTVMLKSLDIHWK